MLNGQFITDHLKDSKTSAFRLDCGHITYPGRNVLCYDNHYFCDEECLMEYLINNKIIDFTVETIPHIRKSTEKVDA